MSTPALDAWRRRANFALRDALWLAAAEEATAAELEHRGCLEAAERARSRACALAAAAVACQDELCDHAGGHCLWWKEWRAARAAERRRGRDWEAARREAAAIAQAARARPEAAA